VVRGASTFAFVKRVLIPLALASAMTGAAAFLVESSHADLENQVFTSREEGLRLVIPRGWRATDQPSYPGFLLWLLRSQPEGTMVLTAEPLTHERYCTWPVACRTSNDALATKYACMLRSRLTSQRMTVGPVQAGPKDTEDAGLPSVWFEYDDGKKFLRQAVAVTDTRTITLVLSANSNEARANHVRSFEQTLRTLRKVSAGDATPAASPATSAGDAGVIDGAPATDAAPVPSPTAPNAQAAAATPPFDPSVPCSSMATQR
jgi:hypothetical protein